MCVTIVWIESSTFVKARREGKRSASKIERSGARARN